MKQLFACLLFLLLAAPTWAAEKEDSGEEAFINNVITIVLDDEMDDNALEKSVKGILQRIKKDDFLGKAAANAKVFNMSSFDLGEVYDKKDYPDFEKYRHELYNLNSALYTLIATEAFAAEGINAPEAKAWLRKCKDAQQRYADVKLPPVAMMALRTWKARPDTITYSPVSATEQKFCARKAFWKFTENMWMAFLKKLLYLSSVNTKTPPTNR